MNGCEFDCHSELKAYRISVLFNNKKNTNYYMVSEVRHEIISIIFIINSNTYSIVCYMTGLMFIFI